MITWTSGAVGLILEIIVLVVILLGVPGLVSLVWKVARKEKLEKSDKLDIVVNLLMIPDIILGLNFFGLYLLSKDSLASPMPLILVLVGVAWFVIIAEISALTVNSVVRKGGWKLRGAGVLLGFLMAGLVISQIGEYGAYDIVRLVFIVNTLNGVVAGVSMGWGSRYKSSNLSIRRE